MAVPNIAFEAPEMDSGRALKQGRPIDLVHLATQTMGDKTLEMEVLQMFAKQARSCLQALAREGENAGAVAHRLKGAANAVGAFDVAAIAAEIEAKGADASRIAAVTLSVIEAENFILKLSRA
ncbi:Hpt domain-containing protein [Allorhizobium sp. BGMRC 0089]|uniref:Hpt domain-containing protein n=1 Tax=Allorhizobium sonneratiae TaxID=2934936 RepID=UPI00203470C5|nr:Hpt domain-containing protein [Allorhizobium sonneratiae]MCM2292834.1 Hpt domain-containing protein [Allorhizobium sonneratiae]